MGEKYLKFEDALILLKSGKKIRNEEWGDTAYHHLEVIQTQEFENENIISQSFIALFYENSGFLPHPYSFNDMDIFNSAWIVLD